MAFFDRTFVDHIQLELFRRKLKTTGVQNVLIPHVRVTSLVEGNLYGRPLHGFTLGNVDINKTPTIDDYFNTKGQGTSIGLTYTADNKAEQVVLQGNKKLPPPGVTNVSISTQSTGGFIFKAAVQLKFYGKEQYDFIYQTMMRPGNPIVIEYGHTHMDDPQNDLGFFQELDQTLIDRFKRNLVDNIRLKDSTNSGRILGLVSNFSVKLNEQNEYEAEIELINALEFLFTLSPEDTFLNYGPITSTAGAPSGVTADDQKGLKYLSRSIRSNFGWEKGEDYDPKLDNIFKQVLDDALIPPNERQTGPGGIVPNWRKYIIIPYGVRNYHPDRLTGEDGSGTPEGQALLRLNHAMKNSGNVYISLSYFFKKLINDILEISYYDRGGGVSAALSADASGVHHFTQTEINRDEALIEKELKNLSAYKRRIFFGGADVYGAKLPYSNPNPEYMGGGARREGGRMHTFLTMTSRLTKYGYASDPDRVRMTRADIEERIEALEGLLEDPEQTRLVTTQSADLGTSATSTEIEVLNKDVDSIGYWPMLRSVNIKDVIINNLNIYNDYTAATTADGEEPTEESGEYEEEKMHNGIDYAWSGCTGAPVKACAEGRVANFRESDSFGNVVEILHGVYGPDGDFQSNGFYSLYAHLQSFSDNMRVFLPVKAGDVIGYIGNTGNSTGAHLHFEVSTGGKPIYRGGDGIDPTKRAAHRSSSDYVLPFGDTNITSKYGKRPNPFRPSAPAYRDPSRQPPEGDSSDDPISGYFYRQRGIKDYKDKYQDDEIIDLFAYMPWWGPDGPHGGKVVYEPSWSAGKFTAKRTNFDGIFVNYEKIRSAFIGSKSVAEAIQKILNMVNAATTDILSLKMRFLESSDITNSGTGGLEIVRVNKIKIYDENVFPSKKEVEESVHPYRFFEDNISEAMSYDFDFSLPGSVAATVMANTFQATEMSAAGGDPQRKALISYGYALNGREPALKSLVFVDKQVMDEKEITKVTARADRSLWSKFNQAIRLQSDEEALERETDSAQKSAKDVEDDKFYRELLGYKELDPTKQKEHATRLGLFNVIPSSGKINIKLQGLDGWRFGDMFTVHNVLPHPYDSNNIFMVTGYKHDISPQGWFTEIDGTMIASIPDNIKEIQAALLDEEPLVENKIHYYGDDPSLRR